MRLASQIKNARMVLIDGNNPLGDAAPGIQVIEEFLSNLRPLAGAASPQRVGQAPSDQLSQREVEVLRLVAGGKSSREIGEELVLSVRTVERHIANIYLKTETHGRAQVTAYAMRNGYT